jgi:hypothetical protein
MRAVRDNAKPISILFPDIIRVISVGLLLMAIVLPIWEKCWAASKPEDSSRNQELPHVKGLEAGGTGAPLGDSGYVVPIPEIKLRSIFGDKPSAPPAEEPQEKPAQEKQPKASDDAQPPQKIEEDSQPTAETNAQPAEPDQSVKPAQPVEKTEAPEESKPETPSTEKLEGKPAPVPDDEFHSPLVQPPSAPEDAYLQEVNLPPKEILKIKTGFAPPPTLEISPVKSVLKQLPLEYKLLPETSDQSESLALLGRRDPLVIPMIEEKKEEAEDILHRPSESTVGSETHEQPTLASKPQQELLNRPEPELRAREPEFHPMEIPKEEVNEPVPEKQNEVKSSEDRPPKESKEQLQTAKIIPREIIASPLDDDAITSPEVKAYLRQTIPVMEELSLLMTRVPSLNIDDYDPSALEETSIPKDLSTRMESMKRELQILDAKTFSIIPPPKYMEFHSIIKQSISETFQACDALAAFLTENHPDQLKKAHEHITKAGELVRQTRERPRQG